MGDIIEEGSPKGTESPSIRCLCGILPLEIMRNQKHVFSLEFFSKGEMMKGLSKGHSRR